MTRAPGDRGFSLIELLVVILVLGILAALVLFAVGQFKDDSQDSACNADSRLLREASTAYFSKFNHWPNGGNPAQRVQDLINAGYLQSAPTSGAILTNNQGAVGGC